MNHILLNNLESKHSFGKKFGQFIQFYKKIFIKKIYKKCGLETSYKSFLIFKESFLKGKRRDVQADFDKFW